MLVEILQLNKSENESFRYMRKDKRFVDINMTRLQYIIQTKLSVKLPFSFQV